MATQTSGTVSSFADAGKRNSVTIVSHRRRPDPLVATYLEQIRKCPLLSRAEEQQLGKRLQQSRDLFRRSVLSFDSNLNKALGLLQQLHDQTIRFDRVINIGVRERQKKRDLARTIAETLKPLARLLRQNAADEKALAAEIPAASREELRRRLMKRRLKAAQLSNRQRSA